MLRLTRRLLPYVLLPLCGLLALSGALALAGDAPPTSPTPMSLAEVESGAPRASDWLALSDGYLLWPAAVCMTRGVGGGKHVSRCFVPLAAVERIERVAAGGDNDDWSDVVVVEFDGRDLRELHPELAKDEIPEEAEPFELSAIVQDGDRRFAMPSEARERFLEQGFERVLVAEYGSAPLSRSGAAQLLVLGLVGTAASLGWIVTRLRRGARTSTLPAPPARPEARVEEGVDDLIAAGSRGARRGLDDALRRSVRNGVDGAFRRMREQEAERTR